MANLLVEKRDIDFVLYEQFEVQKLTEKEKFSHLSKDEFDMVLEQALKFAENDIAPTNKDGDTIGAKWQDGKVTLPESFYSPMEAVGEAGWVSAADDLDAGGQQLPTVIFTATNEMFHAANASLHLYTGLAHGAGKLIELFGADDQKKRFMEKLYSFEWAGTMCLTESGAGSDLAHVATKAVKIDDRHYKIQGQKIFISGGEYDAKKNVIHPVLARIEGAPEGIRGISIFIVPKYNVDDKGNIGKANDVYCSGIEHKMGLKGSATCQLNFGDNNDCVGELLGEPGKGIMIMFNMMNEERLNVGVQASGISSAAYLNALNYARQRLQGTDASKKGRSTELVQIIKHPDIRRELIWMKSIIEGIRALNYYTALCIDMRNAETDAEKKRFYSGLVEFMTPLCKAYSSDRGYEACTKAIQIYGGYGYCSDYPVEQHTRDIKIVSIYEGANGIQAIDLLSRKLPMANGEVIKHLLKEIEKTISESSKDGSVKKYSDIVKTAKDKFTTTANYLVEQMKNGKSHEAFLSATPFLEISGDMILGWMHLWQLKIAKEKLNAIFKSSAVKTDDDKNNLYEKNKEAAYYAGKIHSSQYFITKVLPMMDAKVGLIMNNEYDALEIEEISFGEEMPK